MYYNGGEIWFEHLESMYGYEDAVMEKLNSDIPLFTKPSSTSFLCFVFFETVITDKIVLAVQKAVLESNKRFTGIAFCGLDRKNQRKFRKGFVNHDFGIAFFDGLEDAKVWMLP